MTKANLRMCRRLSGLASFLTCTRSSTRVTFECAFISGFMKVCKAWQNTRLRGISYLYESNLLAQFMRQVGQL